MGDTNNTFDIGSVAQGAASGLAGGAIGGVMGLLLEKHNDRRQIQQQQKLTNMQVGAQERLGQFNQDLQYQMWQKTNYPAQVQQLEKAGLNPALLYGMSGGGGVTTGGSGGNSVSGGEAPRGGGEAMGMGMQMMNMAMMQSQIDLNRANAHKAEADATYTGGTQTQVGKQTLENMKGQLNNVNAETQLTSTQNDLAKVDLEIKQGTKENAINTAQLFMQEQDQIWSKMVRENAIGQETYGQVIDGIKLDVLGKLLTNALTEANTARTQQETATSGSQQALNEQHIKESAAKILQGWKGLGQGDTKLAIDQFRAEIDANYPGFWNVMGKTTNSWIESAFKLVTGKHSWTPEQMTTPQKQR